MQVLRVMPNPKEINAIDERDDDYRRRQVQSKCGNQDWYYHDDEVLRILPIGGVLEQASQENVETYCVPRQ